MNIQLGKLTSQRDIENIYKEPDERNRIDMIDYKESGEIKNIGENDRDRSTDDIEVLKLVTLSSKRDIYNIETEFDERNQINMIDDK